jgi:hypothetical protein
MRKAKVKIPAVKLKAERTRISFAASARQPARACFLTPI